MNVAAVIRRRRGDINVVINLSGTFMRVNESFEQNIQDKSTGNLYWEKLHKSFWLLHHLAHTRYAQYGKQMV